MCLLFIPLMAVAFCLPALPRISLHKHNAHFGSWSALSHDPCHFLPIVSVCCMQKSRLGRLKQVHATRKISAIVCNNAKCFVTCHKKYDDTVHQNCDYNKVR